MVRRSLTVTVVLLVLLIALASIGWTAMAENRPIERVTPPMRTMFDAGLIARGARLASIGGCAGCHTIGNGVPYAGGVPLATPFGKVYSPNITPDAATGIGDWSEAAFVRAMREGIGRGGRHLYPVFPYDHFTLLGDDDLSALYAFVMTRDPASATTPKNELRFPFGFRPLLAAWNLLFLDKRAFHPDPDQSGQWNRGAYLVESLAHCSSCHSPRNMFGAEKHGDRFDGGEAEGWYAPPLNNRSPSPQPWNVEQLAEYLRTGLTRGHAIAGGPMREVTAALSHADESDVQAMAVYIASMMDTSAARQTRAAASQQRAQQPLAATQPDENDMQMKLGASVYSSACASCHDQGRHLSSDGALRLPLATAIYDDDPRSLIHIVREGITPVDGAYGRWMPAFQGTLTDEQISALAAYLRRYAAGSPPWPNLADAVKEVRP